MSDGEKFDPTDGKPLIPIYGVTVEEFNVIKRALNLYATRNMEKETERPGMGWGASAKIADNLEARVRHYA